MEWALDLRGRLPAKEEYFDKLDPKDQAKLLGLFRWLADEGKIMNHEKFRQLGEKAKGEGRGLWEFKSFQQRVLGDFRPGKRFLLAHGVTKKQDDHRPADVERTLRIMRENDQMERSPR